MSTAEEALAATFAHRERAQSLNAVKAALMNLAMLRDSGVVGDFAHPGAGLRINDLEAVVEMAHRVAVVDSFHAVDLVYTEEVTKLRADLAAEQQMEQALQEALATEKAAHLVTLRERERQEAIGADLRKQLDAAFHGSEDKMVILRADYERLIKSLPATVPGLKVVRVEPPGVDPEVIQVGSRVEHVNETRRAECGVGRVLAIDGDAHVEWAGGGSSFIGVMALRLAVKP